MVKILEKNYYPEELADLERDVSECFIAELNGDLCELADEDVITVTITVQAD